MADSAIVQILLEEWTQSRERHGWAVGAYVVMPDHVHFFCAYNPSSGLDKDSSNSLSDFMLHWKQWTSKRIIKNIQEAMEAPIWQEGFFDHLLRSEESYAQRWQYVRENPIRAGLVERVEDWPWKGEIFTL